jgi:hypothetical protein
LRAKAGREIGATAAIGEAVPVPSLTPALSQGERGQIVPADAVEPAGSDSLSLRERVRVRGS